MITRFFFHVPLRKNPWDPWDPWDLQAASSSSNPVWDFLAPWCRICIYVYMCIYVYIYTYVCVYIYTRMYIHIYIYTYIHIYICIHMHTRLCTFSSTSGSFNGIDPLGRGEGGSASPPSAQHPHQGNLGTIRPWCHVVSNSSIMCHVKQK